MEIAVLLGIFVVLLFAGLPIAFSLGISTISYLVVADTPLTILPQRFLLAWILLYCFVYPDLSLPAI